MESAFDGKRFKTGELLARTGISRQVLNNYMTMELVVAVETTESGRHLFDEHAIESINLVDRLKTDGWTLQQIRETFGDRFRRPR